MILELRLVTSTLQCNSLLKKCSTRILPARPSWQRVVGGATCVATLLLLVLCLLDIRWGKVEREIPQKGIEVMFVLDVSRSMLAEDVAPNRLERAKQMIKDSIDEMSGDRVGLAIFAGEVRQRIPMTNHYDDFKQTLDEVGPADLARGGSRLGDAITVAADGFLSQTNDHQAMVILTDGEDQESKPLQAAETVHNERGIRIFTIGLGDIEQGARVPIQNDGARNYLQHDGQQVWSKLDGKTLSEIAQLTSGAYIPAGTKQSTWPTSIMVTFPTSNKPSSKPPKSIGWRRAINGFSYRPSSCYWPKLCCRLGFRNPNKPLQRTNRSQPMIAVQR